MGRRHHSRFWRVGRVYFRRFRIAVWLLILGLLGGLIYLNQVGLPGFVKRPLLEELRGRGLDLQFSRLRWRWHHGIVADDVRFGQAGEPLSPHLALREVQVRLDLRALAHFEMKIDSLVLRQGRLVWPIAPAEAQTGRQLTIENIQTELRFLPNDQWALDHFTAGFGGTRVRLSGVLTNASAVRHWSQLFPPTPAASAGAGLWQARLRRLADTLEQIHFATTPELRLHLEGDARDPQSFSARMSLAAAGAETPWGSVAEGQFTGRVFPASTNVLSRAEVNLTAANARTRWGAITNLALGMWLSTGEGDSKLIRGELELTAEQVQTEWAGGSNAVFTAHWVHAMTNPIPLSGQGLLRCAQAHTRWGSATRLELETRLNMPGRPAPVAADPAWGWWTNLQPYDLEWRCAAAELRSGQFKAESLACSGSWTAPQLIITNLLLQLYQGQLTAQGGLDISTRVVQGRLNSDFDPQMVAALLPENRRKWLDGLTWERPPQIRAEVALVVPPWTERTADWPAEVQPTLRLEGEVRLDAGGTYRGLAVAGARSRFQYVDQCWLLPDLTVTLAGGRVTAEHRANDRTQEYSWRVFSDIDPFLLRPLLSTKQQRVFDLVTLTQAPVLEAEVTGRFHHPEALCVKGRVALTNFTFRGQTLSGLQTSVEYTNRYLRFSEPRVQRGTQRASADGVGVDLKAELVYLTNGFSTFEPMVVARAIGPHIVRAIAPYQYVQPPTARVHGTIPFHGEEHADLRFELDGGAFDWWKFHLSRARGEVHWSGQRLELTNVVAGFYDGEARGRAAFDFRPVVGEDFSFAVTVTNALLQQLMADLSPGTNHLEGRLSGELRITHANTADWRQTTGYGDLALRDGLIWDIPLFGIFTPVLNSISPGLGNSRATAATCSYYMTNGVVRSDDLEIRASAVRLQYRGTVDLEGAVNARVEAELLRDMWLIGPLVSTVFWPVTKMFEYKLSGTLEQPKTEPVYFVPKLIQIPLHPLRTLKGLLPEERNARTNSPANPGGR